ncbi:MAG: cobyrinate a,c-diamide synthase [Selenomonadaceae bacterium]|nr:cobyrinate a,c-diamide synthase [Selenomonadaceae bacterium]
MKIRVPRIVVAATQSGSGKTTITTGIIAALKNRGLVVQSYKIGPDYIDPNYHSLASGRLTHNLDSWLVPTDKLKDIFIETSKDADIAIIEGVMGLYDGGKGGISSTAEIAKLLDAPVVLVVDAKSMGASAAAIALGFREYDKEIKLAGVILNRIGSDNHKNIIESALRDIGIKCFGAIKRDSNLTTPERHLGLLPTAENDTSELIKNIGEAVSSQVDTDSLIDIANNNSDLQLKNYNSFLIPHSQFLIKIAVAKDEAFNFYYPESLNVLKSFGAEIVPFSPLHDNKLPKVSGLIIGGGFPEMFAKQLENNVTMRESIKNAVNSGLPTLAECGGYMYLMNELFGFDNKPYQMVGVINKSAKMNNKLQMVGYVKAELAADCVLGNKGDIFHAHEFHFSNEINVINGQQIFNCVKISNNKSYSAGFFNENVIASYLHIHFAGCIDAAKHFVDACQKYGRGLENG